MAESTRPLGHFRAGLRRCSNADGSQVKIKDVGRVELGAQTYSLRARLTQSPAASLGDYIGPGQTLSLRGVLAGVGFQDPQHFCDRLGVLMRAVARRDDAFALRAVHV
jgi:hypothetical protein